jgi:hypothetical protein
MIKSAEIAASSEIGADLKNFIEIMNKNVEYECTRNVYTEIERCPVGTRRISIRPDTYEEDDNFTLAEADILLVLHKSSPLTLAVLIFKQPRFDVTMLVDLVSTGHLLIEHEELFGGLLTHQAAFDKHKRLIRCSPGFLGNTGEVLRCFARFLENTGEVLRYSVEALRCSIGFLWCSLRVLWYTGKVLRCSVRLTQFINTAQEVINAE